MLVLHGLSPKTNLTYHYIRLREAGLTRTRIEGPQRLITLRSEDIEARFPGLLGAVLAGARSERRLDVMSGREIAPAMTCPSRSAELLPAFDPLGLAERMPMERSTRARRRSDARSR